MAQAERAVVTQAIAELDDEHRPLSSDPLDAAEGRIPIGCVVCWPGSGSWPCVTRMIADDLRQLVSDEQVARAARQPAVRQPAVREPAVTDSTVQQPERDQP